MGWNPCQSLRSFASSQPPLLMFTVCLMAFGLTMAILAYIIGVSEVPNPDVMDWNKFLSRLMETDMCIPERVDQNSVKDEGVHVLQKPTLQSITSNMTHNISSSRLVDRSMSAVLSSVVDKVSGEVDEDSAVVNVSVRIHLTMIGLSSEINSLPSAVRGSVSGDVLNLGRKSSQVLNITMNVLPLTNFSCEEKVCEVVRQVCLTIQVPSILLPHTKSPDKCEQMNAVDATRVNFYEVLAAPNVAMSCSNTRLLHLHYIQDPHLTEMLSLTERSIVNLHLMHTSYFMFVMVTTLLCYALIKGRYPQTKVVILEKVPLDP